MSTGDILALAFGRRLAWITCILMFPISMVALTSVLVSFGLGDSSLRPGVFIEWAVTLPAIGLLLRRGARDAYRQGSARDMPKF